MTGEASGPWTALRHHATGLGGQVAAALPSLGVAAMLAQLASLEKAGEFAVVMGVAAVPFTFGYWGLRSFAVIDEVEAGVPTYVRVRVAGLVLAAAVTWALATPAGLSPDVVGLAILLKVSDGLVDLVFGLTLGRGRVTAAFERYAGLGIVRLLTIFGAWTAILWLAELPATVAGMLACALAVPLVAAVAWHGRRSFVGARRSAAGSAWKTLLRGGWPFAVASAVCAAVTASPRVAAGATYTGSALGVVGTALSVSSLFGMFFHTSWVRWFPRLRGVGLRGRGFRLFLSETLGGAVILAAVAAFVLPPLAAIVFGYPDESALLLARHVLLAAVPFFAAMTIANAFKVTRYPLFESLTYVGGIAAMAIHSGIAGGTPDVGHLLLIGASGMLASGVALFLVQARRGGPPGSRPAEPARPTSRTAVR